MATFVESLPPSVRVLFKHPDIALVLIIMAMVAAMILPLPPFLIDILLTLSITFSIIVLMVSVYANEPLDFSAFPFVLLITTLFRLGMNIATTRQILLNGHTGPDAAGTVIQAFAKVVVGGNYVVGIIIFLVLIIINFVVITKGATRVAEVAARFTLDSMPGKQMAIDADLNAGTIDEQQANYRRTKIRREADFYGSMDGASKFVRGDAIAGLLITAINLIGGLSIGVGMHNMPFGQALDTFTILTVGDGLVGQIPSLIISLATGILVTRSSGDDNDEKTGLATTVARQLLPNTKVLLVAGSLLLIFGLVPGMPKIPFFFVGGLIFLSGYILQRDANEAINREAEGAGVGGAKTNMSELARGAGAGSGAGGGVAAANEEPKTEEDEIKDLLLMDIMELVIGFSLIQLVDESQGGTLLQRIKTIRKQIAGDMGFIVPPVRIKDNLNIDSNVYQVIIKGVKVAEGIVYPDQYLVMSNDGSLNSIEGVPVKDPTYGLDAKWVTESERDRAEGLGCMVIDPVAVVSTHLAEVIKGNASDLLGRQETQELLDNLKVKSPNLIEGVIPERIEISVVNRVLQNLLLEGISIRNLQTIVETVVNYAQIRADIEYLTEKVRYSIRNQITDQLVSFDGQLHVFTLESSIEHQIARNVQVGEEGNEIVLDPTVGQQILNGINTTIEDMKNDSFIPVLVISPPIRYAMSKFISKYISSDIHIISHNEISENVKLELYRTVELNAQG